VGNDAVIGAHSVVLSDVPPSSVAVGVPAVAKKRGKA
jgi:acetyltransferase-like isoleucine patch superfamily enzyme